MRGIISKFGGSSTANAECFRRILKTVESNPARRFIVLSAPGIDADHPDKVTSQLEACWRRRAAGQPVGEAVDAISRRFDEIARALSVRGFAEVARRSIARALSISRAHTLSRGEALCARLFSMFSGIAMLDAARVIRFDADGRPDEAETARRLLRASHSTDRAVIPGFYGADAGGRVVLFPRNGSDITGALVAAGTRASLYENWSDVPGLMTADPAVVPDAHLIRQVGYRQMRRLSRAGAQVLHPDCLDPVAAAGIPTRLRCTTRPECFGTLIDEHFERVVPCVAGKRGADICRIAAFGMRPPETARAVATLDPIAVESDADCAAFTFPPERFEAATQALHGILIP